MNRRDVLKLGAAGAATLAAPAFIRRLGVGDALSGSRQAIVGGTIVGDYGGSIATPPMYARELVQPRRKEVDRVVDGVREYELTCEEREVEILPGKKTTIWGYDGEYPGPTMHEYRGTQSRVTFKNQIDADLSVHLHGSPTRPIDDGHPEILIGAKGSDRYPDERTYEYPNSEESRTLWYHDHAIHNTARNVYQGLAGLYVQHDWADDIAKLPKGPFELELLLGDATFTPDGMRVFDDDGHKDFLGTTQLVNGVPWPVQTVQQRRYRLRMCNGTVGRGYNLKMSNGMPFVMVGTDAGLMPRAASVSSFRMGPAERYSFVLDFTNIPVGTKVKLLNTSADGKMREVMRFDVVARPAGAFDESWPIPRLLTEDLNRDMIPFPTEGQATGKKTWEFGRSGGMWTINDKTWRTGRIDRSVRANDVEIWTMYNKSGGWFHPIHVHLVDFVILDRNGRPPMPYERGYKDVVYVGPNERVRVIAKWIPSIYPDGKTYYGNYVMHCHKVVHEDHDMMNQWEIRAA